LTKTDAKGKDLKKKLVEVLRAAVDEYKGIYVMNFENMRAAKFREIRMDWKESKYVAFTQVSVPTIFFDNFSCM
jgi:ribosomal protein L10